MKTNDSNTFSNLLKNKLVLSLFVLLTLISIYLIAADNNAKNDPDLVDQYINSKGKNIIVFDSSNIKQFWIDKSVVSLDNSIKILLKEDKNGLFESAALRIKLANVKPTDDCLIEFISESSDYSVSIKNEDNKIISTSAREENFINYKIKSAVLHIDESSNNSFYVVFNSKKTDCISIRKIVLSFSKNNLFLSTPGQQEIHASNITGPAAVDISEKDNATYIRSSNSKRMIVLYTSNRFIVDDNTISIQLTVKNEGTTESNIHVGYDVYNLQGVKLDRRNYPYKDINKILNVVSVSSDRKNIIVDDYSDWAKGCYLALNAEDDMSDIPSCSLASSTILEINKTDSSLFEIVMNSAVEETIKQGMKVRIHGGGGSRLYTSAFQLNPGEEKTISSSTKKDVNYLKYFSGRLSRGVYYMIPLITIEQKDADSESITRISNYKIMY